MAQPGFIFGGNTGMTYDQVQKQREIANELLRANMQTPQNVGEGLSAIGRALAAKAIDKRTARADAENRKAYEATRDSIFGALGGFGTAGGGAAPAYAPAPPAGPGAEIADATMSALGKTPMRPFRDAIASIESAGSGDYAAVGPTHPKMGRALGRYQVMEANIGPWSREVLGREVTPEEFLANPRIQDAIFDGKFGGYVNQFGPEGAAQAWFAGPGGVGKMDRQDVLGTSVADYTQKFSAALGGPSGAPAQPQAVQGMANPAVLMALAEVQGNPYASESDKAIASLLMQQTVQAMDPMRALEMERAQLEVDAMRNPAPEQTATMREYDFARSQGYEGTFTDFKRDMAAAGRSTTEIRLGDTMPGIGKLSTDFTYVLNPDGSVRIDPETGLPEARPVPGTPAAITATQDAAKKDRTQTQGRLKLGTTLESLNLNIKEIDDGGLPVTGAVGDFRRTAIGRALTGNNAVDFENRSRQITDSAAFAEIQNMRDNSPTGGAVGQLTDAERTAIGNAVTALNSSTSAAEYKRAAEAYRKLALDLAYGEGTWELDADGQVVAKGEGVGDDGWTVIDGVRVREKKQ